MDKLTIYHNPRCSKSRQALDILINKGLQPIIIEYLKTPLRQKELEQLRAHFELKDFVRGEEKIFKELGLSLDNEQQIMHAMLKEPILMQRPIITYKNKAIIGRPPEKVLELLNSII